jgi:hypothetical protein
MSPHKSNVRMPARNYGAKPAMVEGQPSKARYLQESPSRADESVTRLRGRYARLAGRRARLHQDEQ